MPINGFEDQTHNLTAYELTLVPLFVKGFEKRIGKENAITNKEIIATMKPRYKITDTRVRKIVNHIRNEGLLPGLVASSHGYYVTNDVVELERYSESLAQRANEIYRVKRSIDKTIKTLKAA